MNFIGFESPLESVSLANIMGGELSLFVASSDYKIPCLFNMISITNEHSIPSEPVDSNQYVSDNIIKKPVSISLDLFIYEHNINEFFRLVELGMSADGFLFINRDKRSYENLYVTSLTHQYSGEKLGGFDCSMDLQEVIKVKSMKSTKVAVASLQMVDQGTTVPAKIPEPEVDKRSLLMKIVNKLGAFN